MKLEDCIAECWADHESRTEEVARRLEQAIELVAPDDDAGAARLLTLVNHTVGDHGGDRQRAVQLCETVVRHLDKASRQESYAQLAVARHLVGDEEGALKAESRHGDDAESKLRVRLLVVQAKAHERDWIAAAELYRECLHVAQSLKAGHAAERTTAMVSNNLASVLLESSERGPELDELMRSSAEAARVFWARVGTWVNTERADYLLSRVSTELGDPRAGMRHARAGLETIAENGDERVDQTFLQIALARASKAAGDVDSHTEAILRAQALRDEFEDQELGEWADRELAAAR